MIELLATSTTARTAFLIGAFAVIALVSFVLINLTSRQRAERKSYSRFIANDAIETSQAGSLRSRDNESAWARMATRIEQAGLNLGDSKDERLTQNLKAAGFTSPSAPRVFTLTRLVLVFLLPVLYLTIALTRAEPPGFMAMYVIGSLLGLLGLFLPNIIVRAKADRRTQDIVNGFPDCLDLMLVCIEAGLGIEAAMDRVGKEMIRVHPLVSELLSAAVLRLRAGATRQEAFRALADSTGVDEINSFATLLIQSDKLGTSLGSTLRVYAGEMREKRRMRAEEKAYRLPVLISIPLVVFMLPVMIGVLMLPASIRVVREVAPMLTGGG